MALSGTVLEADVFLKALMEMGLVCVFVKNCLRRLEVLITTTTVAGMKWSKTQKASKLNQCNAGRKHSNVARGINANKVLKGGGMGCNSKNVTTRFTILSTSYFSSEQQTHKKIPRNEILVLNRMLNKVQRNVQTNPKRACQMLDNVERKLASYGVHAIKNWR